MNIAYCQYCGETVVKKDATEYQCSNGHLTWNNPHAAVSVILYQNGKILYSIRGIEPHKGKIDLPGGFLNFNEQPFEGAAREIVEETSLEVKELEPIGAFTHMYYDNVSVTDFLFLCRKWGGTPTARDDVQELVWKPIDTINSQEFAWQYPGLTDTLKEKLL